MTAYLTPKQASELAQIPVGTLQNWRYLGKGPRFVKVDRLIRYPRDEFDAYLRSHLQHTDEAAS